MGTPHLAIRPGHPDFLDLPWDVDINSWETSRLVTMPTGIHRHPVVFVAYEEGIYAIKELPLAIAQSEYEVLRALGEMTRRTAVAVGHVERGWLDPTTEQAGAVITLYVEHSFPYRHLVSGSGFGGRRRQMLDAVAGLLVELHIAGLYWGDCSLSNLLYRWDAGAIEAVMIDGETSEMHEQLSDGQRLMDIQVMVENLAGEMSDIAAMNGVEIDHADLSLGEDIERKYHQLWYELNRELVIGRDDSYLIRERIARLNDLGFSVDEFELEPTDGGNVVRMRVRVGGRTHHSIKLRQLTGIEASENQARLLLSDLEYFLSKSGYTTPTLRTVGTMKWLAQSFEPMLARIEAVHLGSPLQGYSDFLNHRMAMATKAGSDVANDAAFDDWVASGRPGFRVDP